MATILVLTSRWPWIVEITMPMKSRNPREFSTLYSEADINELGGLLVPGGLLVNTWLSRHCGTGERQKYDDLSRHSGTQEVKIHSVEELEDFGIDIRNISARKYIILFAHWLFTAVEIHHTICAFIPYSCKNTLFKCTYSSKFKTKDKNLTEIDKVVYDRLFINPLNAGAEYIGFSLNYYHIQYRLLSMLKP